jgi:hypothetical protein
MSTTTLASSAVHPAHKTIARRRMYADRRLKAAVASVERLEARQLLSANPFNIDATHSVRSAGQSIAVATAIGDVNGDGIPDLVVVNEAVGTADSTVSIFLGNSDGNKATGQFTYSQRFSTGLFSHYGDAAYSVQIATLANGHPDIIISNTSTYNVSVIATNGHGGFAAPSVQQVVPTNYYVDSFTVADVNGDSLPDLVVGAAGGVFISQGQTGTDQLAAYDGIYLVGLSFEPVTQVQVGDVNGDGLPDIVYDYLYGFPISSVGKVGYLNNTGKSTGDELSSPFEGTSPHLVDNPGPENGEYGVISFQLTDLGTYGGKEELVTLAGPNGGPDNYLTIMAEGYNSGSYAFGVAETIFIPIVNGGYDAKVNIGDVNGDGKPDVIVTQYNTSTDEAYITVYDTQTVFPYNVDAISSSITTLDIYNISAYGTTTTFGDVNGDGQVDLVAGYYYGGGPFGKANSYFYSDLNLTASVPTLNGATSTTFLLDSPSNSFLVTTTGSPAPIVSSPNLPDGLVLTNNLDGTATLTGSPDAGPGVYTFTLEAANSSGQDFIPFTLTVDAPPVFAPTGSATFIVGTNNAVEITVNDPGFPTDVETLTLTSGTLPVGLNFFDTGDGTGILSGTAAPGSGGTYTLVFTAANGILPNAMTTVTVTVDEAPAFSSPAAATFTVGTNGSFDINAQSGFPTAGETITLDGSDTTLLNSLGLTLTDNMNGTAEIFGNPVSGSGGTYTITLTATNTATLSASQSLVLTVDEAPTFSGPTAVTYVDGVNQTFDVSADSGFPTAGTVLTATDLPNGLNFESNGDGTGEIIGSPAAGDFGVYDVQITAVNAADLMAMETVAVTVDEPPVFTSAAADTFTVGIPDQDFTLTTTGFPTAGTMSMTGGALPDGLIFTDNGDGTGSISGDPDAGTGGIYSVDLSFTNGVGNPATQVLVLTVDEAPTFLNANASVTFTVGTDGTYQIGAVPGFPVAPETITVDGSDASLLESMGLTLTDNGKGIATISGTPSDDSPLGPQTITLTASNGISPDATETLTITIDEVPSFTNFHFVKFTVGTDQTFDIFADSGFPTAGETISDETPLPKGLTFTDTGDGTAEISGTPAVGTGGFYEIDLVANNGVSPNATQTLKLKIDELPNFTSVNSYTFAVGVHSSFTVTATGHDHPHFTATGLPAGLVLTYTGHGTATISGTPTKAEIGTYGIVLTASNSTGSVNQSFKLIIANGKAPSITSSKTANLEVGVAGAVAFTGTGVPSPSLALTGANIPTGMTFVDNGNGSALLSGTPAPGSQGVYTYTLTAHNGFGKDATQTFTLIVNQPALFTSEANATFTAGDANAFTVVSSGITQAKLAVSGKLPGGLKFTDNGNGTGTISGTPSLTSGGVYTFVVSASNKTEKITQTFTLTVDQLPSLKGLTSAPTVNLTHGKSTSTKYTVIGYPTSIALSDVDGFPTGTLSLSLSGNNLVLQGTPTETGLYTVTFELTNSTGTSDLSIMLNIK